MYCVNHYPPNLFLSNEGNVLKFWVGRFKPCFTRSLPESLNG